MFEFLCFVRHRISVAQHNVINCSNPHTYAQRVVEYEASRCGIAARNIWSLSFHYYRYGHITRAHPRAFSQCNNSSVPVIMEAIEYCNVSSADLIYE